MPDSFEYDVFLSHNSADKPRVRKLAERLQGAGLRVWLDEWVIKPGDDIYLAIEHGLESARVQVLCLSPAALGSEWVALERSTVLFRDPTNKRRRFVPLLLSDCELPDTLRRYKYVDFRAESEAGIAELLSGCRAEEDAMQLLAPPAVTMKPAKKKSTAKRRPTKQPAPTEPLAVLERKLLGHTSWVTSVAVSPDGNWAASGSRDTTIKIWDLETGQCRATLRGHTGQVRSVAITPDGKRILSGAEDNIVRVWDVRSGREVAKLKGHTNSVSSVIALRDYALALSGGWDRSLRLWDLSSGKCLKTMVCGTDGTGKVICSAVNPAGTQALSGHNNGVVQLWNLETGQYLATLDGHLDVVNSIQFTPDGRFAVSGSADKTVKVWDLEERMCVGTLEGHRNEVYSVTISPDGTLIASASALNSDRIRIWEWMSWASSVIDTDILDRGFFSVTFGRDGSRLLCGHWQGSVYDYRVTSAHTTLSAEPARRYVNAKVVLLGEGTVGKTSLAHRLIEDKYVVKDRTHGMNVWPLPLPERANPHPQPLSRGERGAGAAGGAGAEAGDDLDREALLWDLAGQEDYRLIHRLFLDETALALLLINPQKDDPFAEAGDWLKALDTAAEQDSERHGASTANYKFVPTRTAFPPACLVGGN